MRRLTIALPLLAVALLFAAPAQAAKLKTSVTISQSASGSKVVVDLSSSKRISAKRKPRSVVVVAAGRKLKLSRVKATAAAAGYASSWQSKNFTGSYASKLNALGGKRLKVTVSSRSGKSNFKPKAKIQSAGGGGGGPRFAVPSAPLIGDAAWNHIKGYFLNSAFSDCAAGVWPSCAVENRYVHCPDFSWQYRRATPSNGSDINSYYSFTVSGAEVAADGSWGVQYYTSTGGNYVWRVGQNGIANGEYSYSTTYETMPNYFWSQPAITWDKTSGAC